MFITKELDRLKEMGDYQPENSEQTYTMEDFLNLAKGNILYAVILRSRVEWQHPETVVEEDKQDGEILEINGQYVMTDGMDYKVELQ